LNPIHVKAIRRRQLGQQTKLSPGLRNVRGHQLAVVHGDKSVVTGRKFIDAKWKRKCNEQF